MKRKALGTHYPASGNRSKHPQSMFESGLFYSGGDNSQLGTEPEPINERVAQRVPLALSPMEDENQGKFEVPREAFIKGEQSDSCETDNRDSAAIINSAFSNTPIAADDTKRSFKETRDSHRELNTQQDMPQVNNNFDEGHDDPSLDEFLAGFYEKSRQDEKTKSKTHYGSPVGHEEAAEISQTMVEASCERFSPTYLPHQQWTQLRDYGLKKIADLPAVRTLLIVTDEARLITETGKLIAQFKRRKDVLIVPGLYKLENGQATRFGHIEKQAVLREAKLFVNCPNYSNNDSSSNEKPGYLNFLQHAFSISDPIVQNYLHHPCLILVAGNLSEEQDEVRKSLLSEVPQLATAPQFSYQAKIRGVSNKLLNSKTEFSMLVKDETVPGFSQDALQYHWEIWDITDVEILADEACEPAADGHYYPKSDNNAAYAGKKGLCVSPFHQARQHRFHWRESAALELLNNKLLNLESIWHHGASLVELAPEEAALKKGRRQISLAQAGRYIVRCIATQKTVDAAGRRKVQQYVATHNLRVRDLKKIADEELDRPLIEVYELKLRIKHIEALADSSPAKSLLPELKKELAQRRLIARGSTMELIKNRLQALEDKLKEHDDEFLATGLQISGSEYFALERKVDELTEHLHMIRNRLKTLFDESGDKAIRLLGILVSEVTGETYRLVLQISEPYQANGYWHCLVSDVTTKEGKIYHGQAKISVADQNVANSHSRKDALAAVWNAVEKFSQNANYGSGVIKIRLPNFGWYQGLLRSQRDAYFTIEDGEQLFARPQLLALGAAVSLLGLVVSSPTLQFAGSMVGVGLAGARMVERVSSGEFQWDSQAINDLMSVLGFGVGML